MQKGCEMNPREIAKINERKVFKAIKKLPKQGEYFVASLTELARVAQIPEGSMNAIIKRLERKRIIEVKQSVGLFGTMQKRGIKINIPLIKRKRG